MTDAVQAGRGLVDYPGLYPNATGTVVANISGVTAIPGPITLAALAAAMGSTSYQGTWDASTNTPTLASSAGTNGYYYVVSVAGTTSLNGISDWSVGDWAIYNGNVSAWQKVEGGATTMTVGTTTVTGGTSPYLLYNNAGVLGNTTTPAVTSLALGGATIGTNALAVTGTGAFSGALLIADGSAAAPGVAFSAQSGLGLYRVSSGTIGVSINGTHGYSFAGSNFRAGSLGTIGFSSASAPSAANDTTISRVSAGVFGVGTGAQGSIAGGLQAASLALGGATIGSNALAVTGTTLFTGNVDSTGYTNTSTAFQAAAAGSFYWNARSLMASPSDGVIKLSHNGLGDFNRLQFGGTTNLFPAIKRNLTALNFRLADDSADANITAAAATFSGALTVTGTTTIDGGTIIDSNNVLTFKSGGTDRTQLSSGGGTGFLLLRNGTGLAGVVLNFATDTTLQIFGRNGTTPANVQAGTLTLSGALTVPGVTTAALTSTGTFTSGAGAQVGTLTNAPAAGNPTTWIKIIDNGVTRYIPAW